MSLVVAKIDGSKIIIVSDTKLTYPNHDLKHTKADPKDGVLKTVILSPSLSVSFAGDKDCAELAFQEIRRLDDVTELITVLEKHHSLSGFATEFILCLGSENPQIFEIKNGYNTKVTSTWVGDKDGFNLFQEHMLGASKESVTTTTPSQPISGQHSGPGIHIHEMNLSFEVSHGSDLLGKMSTAMDKVIENETVPSVGGFKVVALYDQQFFYNTYIHTYRSHVDIQGSGATVIGHGNAQEGAYMLNFIGASPDKRHVALHLKHGNFGIVYSIQDAGLMYPQVYKADEVDFAQMILKNFGIETTLITQDPVNKYFNDARQRFLTGDHTTAGILFDKAASAAKTDKEKAKVFFNKGIVLSALLNKAPAMSAFTESVRLDPSLASKVFEVLYPKNRPAS